MKTILTISAAAALFLAASGPCFALWEIVSVSKETAKELGVEIRTKAAAPNHVIVELEFKTEGKFKEFEPEGKLKDYCRVDLRTGQSDNPPVTAALREDRTKPGRVSVRFTADRRELDRLWNGAEKRSPFLLVPTLPCGNTRPDALRPVMSCASPVLDAERRDSCSHAERGNEMRRFALSLLTRSSAPSA